MFVARFTNILCKIMYNQYPMSYYWGTDGRTDGRTDANCAKPRRAPLKSRGAQDV